MSNKIDPPTWEEEQQEIDEWIEEREEATQDDFEELMRDLEELEQDDYTLTIAGFWQGTWLP